MLAIGSLSKCGQTGAQALRRTSPGSSEGWKRMKVKGRRSLWAVALGCAGVLIVWAGLATVPRGETAPARPGALQPISQELADALQELGYPNVRTVIVVQPGDKFTVFVPDPQKGTQYNIPANRNVKLPDTSGDVKDKDFNELVVVRKNSPATIVVCERIGGQKVCWEENV